MSSTQTFDAKTLLDMTGENRETINEVISYFLSDTPRQFANLAKAIADKDAKTAERIAHSIKGVAATVGCPALSAAALKVEQTCRNSGTEAIRSAIPDLQNCFAIARRELMASGLVETPPLAD